MIVYGLNGTTVNGDAMAYFFASRIRHAVCEMDGGDDLVIGFGMRLSSFECNLYAGDDVLAIFRSRIRRLTATGGDNYDLIINRANRIHYPIVSGFESSM